MKHFLADVRAFFDLSFDSLYPERSGTIVNNELNYDHVADALKELLNSEVCEELKSDSDLTRYFVSTLPGIKEKLNKDLEAIYMGDPAAQSKLEVIMAYPGFLALAAYRIAHELYHLNLPLIPRIITEYANTLTSIDIHPGARLGTHICIDHGSGVVIGETAIIGDHVKIYQGVTLGALSIPKTKTKIKRHPTIGDHVIIYAQATILGGETTIGNNSTIGGNVWITESVPENSKVFYDPWSKQSTKILRKTGN